MTQPTHDDTARRTQIVTIAGRSIVVRELIDVQLMHLARYARILSRDDVAVTDKLDCMGKMLAILHSSVKDADDLAFLIEQEEAGEISLRDLQGFAQIKDPEETPDVQPVVRRRRSPIRNK